MGNVRGQKILHYSAFTGVKALLQLHFVLIKKSCFVSIQLAQQTATDEQLSNNSTLLKISCYNAGCAALGPALSCSLQSFQSRWYLSVNTSINPPTRAAQRPCALFDSFLWRAFSARSGFCRSVRLTQQLVDSN